MAINEFLNFANPSNFLTWICKILRFLTLNRIQRKAVNHVFQTLFMSFIPSRHHHGVQEKFLAVGVWGLCLPSMEDQLPLEFSAPFLAR